MLRPRLEILLRAFTELRLIWPDSDSYLGASCCICERFRPVSGQLFDADFNAGAGGLLMVSQTLRILSAVATGHHFVSAHNLVAFLSIRPSRLAALRLNQLACDVRPRSEPRACVRRNPSAVFHLVGIALIEKSMLICRQRAFRRAVRSSDRERTTFSQCRRDPNFVRGKPLVRCRKRA